MELREEQLRRWLTTLGQIDTEKLEMLARWFDVYDDGEDRHREVHRMEERADREVQRDLRRWKANLREVTQEMREALA